MKKIIMFFVLFTAAIFAQANAIIEMPAIFSNNMVLQQQTQAPFWGKALPGSTIKIDASWGASAQTIVPADSIWMTKLKTPKAGGPYTIKLQIGESVINYNNVLSGEVWLCSGQSNMEMPMLGFSPRDSIEYARTEINNAVYPGLRFFTVLKGYSYKPQFNLEGTWLECNPNTAAAFSATAFFFGKKLYKELNVPVGLINTSWGGTPCESWASGEYLEKFPEFKDYFANISTSIKQFDDLINWRKSMPVVEVNYLQPEQKWKLSFQDSACSSPEFDDSRWKEMDLPRLWETTDLGGFDGAVWFRKKVEIPESWINKDIVIELGPIDDVDITFVNGVKVGGYETDGHYQTPRIYDIPANIVKTNLVSIAVRVIDSQGGGGIYGKPEQMNIHLKNNSDKISLTGNWKYLLAAEFADSKFYVFGSDADVYLSRPKLTQEITPYSPATLYNKMIHPLEPFAIKGAIWYQGEANVGRAELYKTLFPAMIKNWRTDWQEGDFPFYYVQIAPFAYGPGSESQRIREAQLLTLAQPHTGMAVTMDITTVNNIHPPYKKEVGDRLAFWALAKDYKKNVLCSGPVYKSMKINQDKITISFDYAKGLTIKELYGESNLLIAGEDGVFKKADYKIKNNKLIVSSPEVNKPAAVRYAWSDTAEGTIFNGEGLPASSFRTDDWAK